MQIQKMLILAFVVCSCTSSAKQQQEQAQTPDTKVVQVKKEQKKEGTVFYELTLGEAMEKAKQEGKNVFIDCYTQSCAPCRQMAKLVFPKKEEKAYGVQCTIAPSGGKLLPGHLQTLTILLTPLSSMATPKRVSQRSMVPLRWVTTTNWVSRLNSFK